MSDTLRIVSLGRRLSELALQHGDRAAVLLQYADRQFQQINYATLDAQSNQVARLMAAAGVAETSRVAIALPNSIEWFVSCFAVWKLGACVFTIRSDLPDWETQRLFEAARPSHSLGVRPGKNFEGVVQLDIGSLEGVNASILPDRIPKPFKINATGGSTGVPKIVVPQTPGVIAVGASAQKDALRLTSGQVQLVAGPLYHYGPSRNAIAGVTDGHTVVIFERFDPQTTMEAIEQHKVQIGMLVPTMLFRILKLADYEKFDVSSLLRMTIAGAKCADWLFEKAIAVFGPEALFVGYGGTENIGVASATAKEWLSHRGTAGKPIFTDVRIQDEQGNALMPEEVGEIWMRPHGGVSTAYLGQEMRQTEDGFATLGDIGWLDPDGYLYVADRRTDMIVSGGSNVYPAEVESALLRHPGISDAAVVGRPDPEWGTRVHAVLVAFGGTLDNKEVKTFCSGLLAPYKVPRSFEWRDILPRDDLGKLRRSSL